MVLTDIIKRWHVLKGEKAVLCTGTDEHGLKVQRAAAKAGVDPKLFCDKGAEIFEVRINCMVTAYQRLTNALKELARKAEITNDHFVRTTDRGHKDAVQYAWV
jgi:methionyl-tRNA synthetase